MRRKEGGKKRGPRGEGGMRDRIKGNVSVEKGQRVLRVSESNIQQKHNNEGSDSILKILTHDEMQRAHGSSWHLLLPSGPQRQ